MDSLGCRTGTRKALLFRLPMDNSEPVPALTEIFYSECRRQRDVSLSIQYAVATDLYESGDGTQRNRHRDRSRRRLELVNSERDHRFGYLTVREVDEQHATQDVGVRSSPGTLHHRIPQMNGNLTRMLPKISINNCFDCATKFTVRSGLFVNCAARRDHRGAPALQMGCFVRAAVFADQIIAMMIADSGSRALERKMGRTARGGARRGAPAGVKNPNARRAHCIERAPY
ncbi:hypothetical protein EVAR_28987_1 [Eumeta japonica]|uniref:Uncharacterized protein n=1 Tax=Eumeta variegata TaxID=151549 RepID=A0A4C1W420_EUMVA|nr:hypothetical protein EVAR_28987_1 [Eumeta japonica]